MKLKVASGSGPEPTHLLPLPLQFTRLLVITVSSLVPRAALLTSDKLVEPLQCIFKTLAFTYFNIDRHQYASFAADA